MLTVRPESREAMQRERVEAADRRLVEYAQRRFPAVFKPQNSARSLQLVRQLRERAGEAGITREDNVANFIDLSTMYGLDFDKAPWAADVMHNEKHTGSVKISILKRRLHKRGIKI